MKTYLRSEIASTELPAPMTVVAILLAGVLTKLGYGWCGVAAMVALCLLGTVRKPKPAIDVAAMG